MSPRLRVANVRFLLLSLSLVASVLLWRRCTSPAQLASRAAEQGSPSVSSDAADAGQRPLASLRATTGSATPVEAGVEDREPHAAEAEAVLARIESDRRAGRHDEASDALEIRTLVSLTRIGAAHAKLQHFAERYPTSRELPALVRLTGYHPRPMGRPTH